MATSQHAYQPSPQSHLTHLSLIKTTQPAIDLESVSLSQLLGRDYLFINNKETELSCENPIEFHAALNDLIETLALTEAHTVAVTVDESDDNLAFIRHDLTWHKHAISHINSIAITQSEQHEFMDMIWRCSTSCNTAVV